MAAVLGYRPLTSPVLEGKDLARVAVVQYADHPLQNDDVL